MRVFLGGTCNESVWREQLMPMLDDIGVEYFNPVVDDWDESAYKLELEERETCDICLYAITPKMTGVYSIAEVVDDSNKRSDKTILCVLDEGDMSFDKHQLKSIDKVGVMVTDNGAKAFNDLDGLVGYIKDLKAKNDEFGLIKSL